ncbi:hypothetical protein RFI_38462, partial [Reticulomyxa filosa]
KTSKEPIDFDEEENIMDFDLDDEQQHNAMDMEEKKEEEERKSGENKTYEDMECVSLVQDEVQQQFKQFRLQWLENYGTHKLFRVVGDIRKNLRGDTS